MYYILLYKTVDNYLERRPPYREAHLALATAAYQRGEMLMAGALEDPVNGALLVFKGDGPEAAKAFAQNDPYVKAGLILEWQVRPWKVVIGG